MTSEKSNFPSPFFPGDALDGQVVVYGKINAKEIMSCRLSGLELSAGPKAFLHSACGLTRHCKIAQSNVTYAAIELAFNLIAGSHQNHKNGHYFCLVLNDKNNVEKESKFAQSAS